MILVDTSVLIDFFKGNNKHVKKLKYIINNRYLLVLINIYTRNCYKEQKQRKSLNYLESI